MMKSNISATSIEKVTGIFNKNGWGVTEHAEEFNRFCNMLENLSPEQQDLILELTQDFLWVTLNKYENHLYSSLGKIEKDILTKCNAIYIMPLLPFRSDKENEIRNESAIFTRYLIKVPRLHNDVSYKGKKICLIDKPSAIPRNIDSLPAILILVDDFIGTGETAESAINDVCSLASIKNKQKILVVSLVAQEMGIERLKGLGVQVYASIVRNRGIGDRYLTPAREKNTEIMRSIEDLIKVENEFRFGYKRTEALVSMIKTPNNTFPIYWCENSKEDGSRFIAPFPRD